MNGDNCRPGRRGRRRYNFANHPRTLYLQPDSSALNFEFLNGFPGREKVDEFFQFLKGHKFESEEYSKERFSSYRRRPICSPGAQTKTAKLSFGKCRTTVSDVDEIRICS